MSAADIERKRLSCVKKVTIIQSWYRRHVVETKLREAHNEFRDILKRIDGVSDERIEEPFLQRRSVWTRPRLIEGAKQKTVVSENVHEGFSTKQTTQTRRTKTSTSLKREADRRDLIEQQAILEKELKRELLRLRQMVSEWLLARLALAWAIDK